MVDGTVTDDADALLFGAQIVYRNLFNQNKHVEMFAISNIEKDMGLNQDRLIQMAYLLGSDYTDGLTGVGGVWAFEVLKGKKKSSLKKNPARVDFERVSRLRWPQGVRKLVEERVREWTWRVEWDKRISAPICKHNFFFKEKIKRAFLL